MCLLMARLTSGLFIADWMIGSHPLAVYVFATFAVDDVQGLTLAMCPLARTHFLGGRASSGHNN